MTEGVKNFQVRANFIDDLETIDYWCEWFETLPEAFYKFKRLRKLIDVTKTSIYRKEYGTLKHVKTWQQNKQQ